MEVDEFNEDIDLNCMKVRKTRANSEYSNKGQKLEDDLRKQDYSL